MIGETLYRRRRPPLFALGLGVVVAAGLAILVLILGAWAFAYRQLTLHDGRLKRLVELHPSVGAATRGLLAETGNRVIEVPETEAQLRQLVAQWAPARVEEVMAKKRQWPMIRVFGVGDMVYVLYFDGRGALQDYVLLAR